MNKNKDIIKSCLNGDRQAFSILVDKYKSFVCSLVYCQTGDIDRSRDIAADVFVNLWKNLPLLPDVEKFHPWLAELTGRVLKDKPKDKSPSGPAGAEELLTYTPLPTDPTEEIFAKEESMNLWRILESLPLSYRETIVVYYRHEKCIKQTALLLSISEQTARANLTAAREMLREKAEHKIEAGIRDITPDKSFTAMVLTAISTIPMPSSARKSAAMKSAKGALFSLPIKIAAAAALAALIIICAIVSRGTKLPQEQTPSPNAPLTAAVQPQAQKEAEAKEPAKPSPAPKQPRAAVSAAPVPIAVPVAAVQAEQEDIFIAKGVLSGIVSDKQRNEPIAGISLKLTFENAETQTATTDTDGFYSFETVAADGLYDISVDSPEYVRLTEAYNNKIAVNLSPQSQEIKDIELERACILEVMVTEKNGAPVEAATVILTESPFSSSVTAKPVNGFNDKTDANGTVTIGGIRASQKPYLLTVWYIMDAEKAKTQNTAYLPSHSVINLTQPDVVADCVVVLAKSCIVEGYIFDNSGSPRAAAEITATAITESGEIEKDIPAQTVSSDAAGFYRFDNLSEQLWIISCGTHSSSDLCFQKFTTSQDIPTVVNFGGGNFVSGKVLFGTEPAGGCKIAIADSPDYNTASFASVQTTTPDGGFVFSGIMQGTKYLLQHADAHWMVLAEFETYSRDLSLGDIVIADQRQP